MSRPNAPAMSEADRDRLWCALEVAAHRARLYEYSERLREIAALHFLGPGGVCAFCVTRYPCVHARLACTARSDE